MFVAGFLGLLGTGTVFAASLTRLGDLPGGLTASFAYGLSADGTTATGFSWSVNAFQETFRWQGGVMTGLGDFPVGAFSSIGYAASADGSTVVGFGNTAAGQEAFDLGEPSVPEPSTCAAVVALAGLAAWQRWRKS